jgi:biopolymer transport protein ExbD
VPRQIPLTSVKIIKEINLTPLMDLTFILLITFIITFPLIEQGISVKLPEGSADSLSSEEACTITVDQEAKLFLDNKAVSLEELSVQLAELGRVNKDLSVMVRADERVRYGSVVKVLKILHDLKISKMALVTQSDD